MTAGTAGPPARGAARKATAKPTPASIAVAARTRSRGGNAKLTPTSTAVAARTRSRGGRTAGLWSADPFVAPSRGAASIPSEPGREDGVVAIACAMRTPADPQSKIKGSLYCIDGIALGFLQDRWPWEDLSAEGEDDAGTSCGAGTNKTGTWGSVDDDGQFPSLIDIFLRHGGSLETVQELIRGVTVRTEEKMENWGPVGSVFEPPLTQKSPTFLWMTGRKQKSGSIWRSSGFG